MAAKLKKKTDITADKIIEDEPLEFGAMKDDDELDAESNRLPGEEVWEREALVSTKSTFSQSLSVLCFAFWLVSNNAIPNRKVTQLKSLSCKAASRLPGKEVGQQEAR